MAFACVQDIYLCDQCKSAADIHGRGCAHGLMFPVLLVMANQTTCPNYEFDPRKVEERLQRREEERRNG